MTSFVAAASAPGTNVVTTAETLAANIPPTQFTPPPNATAVIIRGRINITTGTGVTSLSARLRGGQNNTTTNQIDSDSKQNSSASLLNSVVFFFIDTNLQNITIAGYSLNLLQNGATGNGTINNVDYEVDYVIP